MSSLDITRPVDLDLENEVLHLELILSEVSKAQQRWQDDCDGAANSQAITGQELMVLQTIRKNDRFKTISDVGRALNRSDSFNLQHYIKKLQKLGLIERVKLPNSKALAFKMTQAGIVHLDNYKALHKKFLLNLFKNESNLNVTHLNTSLERVKGVFERASRAVIECK